MRKQAAETRGTCRNQRPIRTHTMTTLEQAALQDAIDAVTSKLDSVRPAPGSAAHFEQMAQRTTKDILSALVALSQADLTEASLPIHLFRSAPEVHAVFAATLLLLDADPNDLSWAAAMELLRLGDCNCEAQPTLPDRTERNMGLVAMLRSFGGAELEDLPPCAGGAVPASLT